MNLPLTKAPLCAAPANAAWMVFIWFVVAWIRLLRVVPDPLSVVSKCPPMSLPSCLIRHGPGAPGKRTLRRSSLLMRLCANAHVFSVLTFPRMSSIYSWVRRRARAMLVAECSPVSKIMRSSARTLGMMLRVFILRIHGCVMIARNRIAHGQPCAMLHVRFLRRPYPVG